MSHLFDRLSRPFSSPRGAVRPELPNRFEPALDQPVVSRQALSLETHEEREVSPRAATSMPRPARGEPVGTRLAQMKPLRSRPAAPPVERTKEPLGSAPAPRESPAGADLPDLPRPGAAVEPAAVRLAPVRTPSPAPALRQAVDRESSRVPQADFSVRPQLVDAAPVALPTALRSSPQSGVSELEAGAFSARNQGQREPAETPPVERRELGVVATPFDTPRRSADDRSLNPDSATRTPAIKMSGELTSRTESAAAPKSTIRVHIGRVEVRAVAAAPTAPAPRPAKASLPSLDDYLSPGRER